jgi:hypothetical protein
MRIIMGSRCGARRRIRGRESRNSIPHNVKPGEQILVNFRKFNICGEKGAARLQNIFPKNRENITGSGKRGGVSKWD